jgi:hypothetical protein
MTEYGRVQSLSTALLNMGNDGGGKALRMTNQFLKPKHK